MRTRLPTAIFVGFFLFASILSLNVFAQENLAESEREPNLIGKVVDAETSGPVMAEILVHGGPEDSFRYQFKTERDGVFKAVLPQGTVYLLIEAEGYQSLKKEVEIGKDPVEMRFLIKKTINDEPEPNLHGRLISEDGTGIHGIISFHMENSEGITVESDRGGSFSIHIKPGTYIWHAKAEGYQPRRGEISVPRGEPVRMKVRMEPAREEVRTGMLAGHVLDPDGEPLPFTEIMIMHLNPTSDSYSPGEKWIETGERGYFKVELPFGAYFLEAHHEGFLPFHHEFRIWDEKPEMKLRIMMEWEQEEERIHIHMEYKDENSDGHPEELIIEADLDSDDIPDVVIEMYDENSDGNPESVVLDMNLPRDEMNEILFLILEKASRMPPFGGPGSGPYPWGQDPDRDHHHDDEPGPDEDPYRDPDTYNGFEENYDGETDTDDSERGNSIMVDNGYDEEESSKSDKGSNKSAMDDLPVILAMTGAILVIVAFVVIGGYALRFRKDD
jgi:hypothetical protein